MKQTAVFLLFCCGLLSSAQGQLAWEKTQVELKVQADAAFADAAFPFTNKGSTEITIRSVVPSCSCTTAKPTKEVIAPGEQGAINARFTVGQRDGRQEKTILVTTSDAPTRPITLHLVVHIPQLLRIHPTFLSWELGETPAAKMLVVEAAPTAPLKSLAVLLPDGRVFHQEVRTVTEGLKYEIVLTPEATGQLSMNSFRIQCEYPDGHQRSLWSYARISHVLPTPPPHP